METMDGPEESSSKRTGRAVPMVERWANDRWPDRLAANTMSNGGLNRDPAVVDKALGAVVGAAIGNAVGGGDRVGGPLRFGRATALAVVEANVFVSERRINPAALARAFSSWETQSATPLPTGHDPTQLALTSISAARWAFVDHLPGTVRAARELSVATGAGAAVSEARALTHCVVKRAVGARVRTDPFLLPPHLGSGDASDVLVEYLEQDQQGLARAALTGSVSGWGADQVWVDFADAVRIVRKTNSLDDCMTALESDAARSSTVGAVAGCISGAIGGLRAVSQELIVDLRGEVAGAGALSGADLSDLASRVLAVDQIPTPPSPTS